ncbi:TPA: hypothetical protein ACN33P_004816 [Vibrio parahaemolyticus]|nr:hypothetical protein [Vibrio parahaemolyticus]ELA8132859.1 hypothetical protein [Vibrio parahaemolyticus]
MFRVKISVFLVAFHNSILNRSVRENCSQVSFEVGFSVLEADSLVESQLCNIVCPKALFGVVSSFSTAFHVPSGFSDSRFETALDLRFLKHAKLVLAKQ